MDGIVNSQKLLLCMLHGYMEVLRDRGFRSVHLRVPPPDEENVVCMSNHAPPGFITLLCLGR